MFLVSTKGYGGPLRINDMRSGATIEEAMATGDRLVAASKYRPTLRIWKLSPTERPILVAERNTYRGAGEDSWQLTARGRKLVFGE